MRNKWLGLVVSLLAIVVGLILLPRLPEQVATQWDSTGEQVTNFMPRLTFVLSFPAAMVGILVLKFVLPLIDPRGKNYRRFASSYQFIMNSIILFIATIYFATLLKAIGWDFSIVHLTLLLVGLLFVIMGNEMGRIRPNWFLGIRTPWTLSNEVVWKKTHRLGGRLFFLTGLVTIMAILFIPGEIAMIIFSVLVASMSLFLVVYSYWIWRGVS